jgi:hypothetical protein
VQTLSRLVLFAIGLAGLAAFTSQSRERHGYWRWDEEQKQRVSEGHREWLRVGLSFSPWYEEDPCVNPYCGTVTSRLNVLSWSWVAFGVGMACLWLAVRVRGQPEGSASDNCDQTDPA